MFAALPLLALPVLLYNLVALTFTDGFSSPEAQDRLSAQILAVHMRSSGPWSISLDDFVTSRLLELIIHADDLAYSVDVATPAFPPQAVETVVDILSRIALRRHGATHLLRALSRSERAPASISAL